MNNVESMFGKMRDLTPAEEESYNDSLLSQCEPTNTFFYDEEKFCPVCSIKMDYYASQEPITAVDWYIDEYLVCPDCGHQTEVRSNKKR